MNREAIDAALGKISIKNPAFPIEFSWSHYDEHVSMRAVIDVPDSDTGLRTRIYHVQNFSGDLKPESAAHMALMFLRGVFIHEADEAIHMDGKKHRDPHQHDRKTT